METNLVLLLCIALIFVTVNGDVEIVTNSNSTDTRLDNGSEVVVSTNVTDSKSSLDHSNPENSMKDDNTQLTGDGSKINGSDENESTKKNERFHGEECDPSNMCKDEEDEFVACLRVPGNDAPHLSLLIQNKGEKSLVVSITAPSFVRLEKNKVQLQENEDTKVKVSIRKGKSNDTVILLTSDKGRCSLELKNLAHETGNDDTVPVARHSIFNISSRTLTAVVMISFLVLSLVIIPMIIHVYKKKKAQGNNNIYQRLDMELPVSNNAGLVSKSDQETGSVDDGWNNNWGDDWGDGDGDGDEEQPNTPVLPVTPSVSSRGLASRRLSSKEGWKD